MKVSWPGSGVLALSEDASAYALTPEVLGALQEDRVPDAVRMKLEYHKARTFANARELEQHLKSVLSESEYRSHGRVIVKRTAPTDWLYLLGLGIFALTVVGYTLIGGFLAAVWTDLFQSVMMFIGVVVLVCLAVPAAGGLESATLQAMKHTSDAYAFGPGYAADDRAFLPLGLAISFWVIWVFSGLGSPAGMVRIMAGKNAEVIRKSMCLLAVYNFFIYLPLIAICICARAIMPNVSPSDEVIPRMALFTTRELPGGSFIAGLILAAPFGAIMATVSGYLVVIASGLVRDIYQRFINPQGNEYTVRRLSYLVMIMVGLVAVALNVRPVAYLQVLVVFSGTGAAAAFVVPCFMLCYWRRATARGTIAAMLAGAGSLLVFYVIGLLSPDPKIGADASFRPYYLFGLDPLLWSVTASLFAGIGVSLRTQPPEAGHVARLFDADKGDIPAATPY
jgi:SSS family solute:Na+ symporter/sodium/pantothenate symporter